MTMRVTFEISDKDLRHFRECMQKARDAVRDADESDIIDAARELFLEVAGANAPTFITARLEQLEAMVGMLTDEDWAMPEPERSRVLCALVYFCDPEDLIPDSIPGIGYLDDAIMIELVFRELKHEVEGYKDFVAFRDTFATRMRGSGDARTARLEAKRGKLLERIKRRKAKDAAPEVDKKRRFSLWK
ncbi:MAG: YkvA family protein [Gammaproteobacteria bacterium]